MVLDAQVAVNPDGRLLGVPIPLAPVVVCVIGVIGLLIQSAEELDAELTVFKLSAVIVPIALIVAQANGTLIVYGNTPGWVTVPLMVIVSASHEVDTPGGSPVEVPVPVAPATTCFIGVIELLTHNLGEDDVIVIMLFVTVIVPVAFTVPQPPLSGIV